ncbi:flagellar assembly peptidoglycan hydrolase FlgJ [Luteimonas sp. MHLX1A]|uniref:flagellar assembly peptidoglycan hydrolase FlgJ n=1 Tax=Alterluteimonas muca TaxID=2878684 RepID=UPI001E649E67|nr:flagellar assembly peptidoglycan hydrolase FlgJ [Luteimonas sp. MHLX1A]MCD9045743.1 flagellar assembly peptidoglycan hydrolase FlgJ [Luteimonas sp. MHLX1A]
MRISGAPIELNPAQRHDAARIDQVAREFEGVFAQMMIKSMRDASFGDALFPGENQLYRDLYDQRLAKSLTEGEGLGLAKVIARQLGGGADPATALDTGLQPAAVPALPLPAAAPVHRLDALPESLNVQALDMIAGRDTSASEPAARSPMDALVERLMQQAQPAMDALGNAAQAVGDAVGRVPAALEAASRNVAEQFGPRSPEGFVASIWGHAQQAARELGVDARALVAQAALETGWGRRMIQRGDGNTANNLFGIKATGWKGERAAATTHEYSNGVRHTERADFRAYGSPAESFADYVRMIKHNPRYRQALESGGDVRRFASALQQAGYATDPRYADKISSIANGPTLDRALSAISAQARSLASTTAAPSHVLASAADAARQAVLR